MSAAVSPRRVARRPQLEIDTPLVALAAARSVLDEAAVLVGRPLPARFAARLAHRARRVYAHSDSFRRKLRARGDSGRDWLHVFLRHWLAALLRDECPALFARLPAAFANGNPCALPAAVHPTERPPPKTRRSLSRS
ncbi:MAG TPA: hypothetical protein VK178_13455 [Opitutaceae bacterium]|nr:hypothetical protein [Opitutaceae bacterium]